MNERPTPRTDKLEWATEYCENVVYSDVARTLEHELAELKELYDLDTQFLRAERDALRDALRVRISEYFCPDCKSEMEDGGQHCTACRHAATEREVTQ